MPTLTDCPANCAIEIGPLTVFLSDAWPVSNLPIILTLTEIISAVRLKPIPSAVSGE